MEGVDEGEREAAAVVALALVDGHAIGAHRPAIVDRIKNIVGRDLDGQRFAEKRLADRGIHRERRCIEAVGVDVTSGLPDDIGRYRPAAWQCECVVEIVGKQRFVVARVADSEPLTIKPCGNVGRPA